MTFKPTICDRCGNELNRSADWIHLGVETEHYQCRKCYLVTVIPAQKDKKEIQDLMNTRYGVIAEHNLDNRMKNVYMPLHEAYAGISKDLIKADNKLRKKMKKVRMI